MHKSKADTGLMLHGLDGSNPLGFLAAVGVTIVADGFYPGVRVGWRQTGRGWRPSFLGCGDDEREFSERILETLRRAPTTVFDIDNKMPYDVGKFSGALQETQKLSSIMDRRNADLLAGMGTELYPDKKGGQFQDSKFRMVRSGDSAGQGLPYYAKANLEKLDMERLHLTLFEDWDYKDERFNLGLDPIGFQPHALRWYDPSKKSKQDDGPGTMRAANCLAIEALQSFPVLPVEQQVKTTGFQQISRREIYFVWPIWTPMLETNTVRSLLALPDLAYDSINRAALAKRGIQEVYRSQRVRKDRYYSSFLPGQPI